MFSSAAKYAQHVLKCCRKVRSECSQVFHDSVVELLSPAHPHRAPRCAPYGVVSLYISIHRFSSVPDLSLIFSEPHERHTMLLGHPCELQYSGGGNRENEVDIGQTATLKSADGLDPRELNNQHFLFRIFILSYFRQFQYRISYFNSFEVFPLP